jgi:colanic acid/amylovoran biosynthesis glycosyltransferase
MSVAAANLAGREAASSTRTPLRLAYLTAQYPKISHTFIRREIEELERRGHEVMRLAIRPSGEAMVDARDCAETGRTFFVLDQPKWRLVAALGEAIRRPARALRALGVARSMHRRSDRGLARHLAYLLEAMVLVRELRRLGIRHVHVHFGTNPAAVARLMKALGGFSYSLTIHGPDEFDAAIGLDLEGKITDAAFVAVISEFAAAQVRRWVRTEHWEKIHVVRCAIDDEFLEPVEPIRAENSTLLSIGRLSAQKGQVLLLEAIAELMREGRTVQLVLAGDGELRGLIEERIAALRLNGCIEITGWIDGDEVRRRLAAARALVLPSVAEGLPVVIMEALAMGRPVVSTHVAGIPELVRDHENGWLVPAGSKEALVAVLREVLEAPADRLNEMGQAGRAAVRRAHSLADQVDRLESLLRSVS